jgi:hypothetical protein
MIHGRRAQASPLKHFQSLLPNATPTLLFEAGSAAIGGISDESPNNANF